MDLKSNKLGLLELPSRDALDLVCTVRTARRNAVKRQTTKRKQTQTTLRTQTSKAVEKLSLRDLESILEAVRGRD